MLASGMKPTSSSPVSTKQFIVACLQWVSADSARLFQLLESAKRPAPAWPSKRGDRSPAVYERPGFRERSLRPIMSGTLRSDFP
jgi:hypothetical protein